MHHPGQGQGQGHVPLADDAEGSPKILPCGPTLREIWHDKSEGNTQQHELKSCDDEGSKDAPGASDPQVPKPESESLGAAHVINMGPIVETSALQFADTAMRNGFVRKVFGIISLQLLLTVGFILVCCLVQPVQSYLNSNYWTGFAALGLALIVTIAAIYLSMRKNKMVWPYDMLALGVFTVVWAIVLGTVSAAYQIEMILLAVGVTAAVVLSIAIFAVNTKIDATTWTSMLVAVGWTFVVLMLSGFFWHIKVWKLVVTGLACMLLSAYLIHDIQLVVGGKHRQFCFNPDDYVLAALIVYMDIINLFLWILSFGSSGGN